MAESNRPQIEVYEETKGRLANELGIDVLKWDFDTMLKKLGEAIHEQTKVDGKRHRHAIRYFARHFLKMSGEAYNKVSPWLTRKSPMSVDEITLVLRTLNHIYFREVGNGSLKNQPARVGHQSDASRTHHTTYNGVIRKLIDHSISILNSLIGLIAEAGVSSSDVLDGDRMQIRSALQRVCGAYGIKVVFTESKKSHTPVTRDDLSEIGIDSFDRRRGDNR